MRDFSVMQPRFDRSPVSPTSPHKKYDEIKEDEEFEESDDDDERTYTVVAPSTYGLILKNDQK
jgi:hypothetical protein